jgi:hypothetical protein
VDRELELRNAYLAMENRTLHQQSKGRMQLSVSDCYVLVEISKKLVQKTLKGIATVAQSDTILAWCG